jgi:alpha-2-macroglobulin
LQGLVIEDPLPAGLEPVDTQLNITSTSLANAIRTTQPPGWQPWTHIDMRSDHVALFASYVTHGAYQYTYLARAALPGEYRVLPVNGREQYFPDVFARGDGQHFSIRP